MVYSTAALVALAWVAAWQLLSIDAIRQRLGDLQLYAAAKPMAAAGILAGIATAVHLAAVPVASLLTVLAGVVFGRWMGMGIMALAATIGCSLSMLLSRRLIGPPFAIHLPEKTEALNRRLEKHGPYDLFALRMTPFIPSAVVNVLMGVSTMPLVTHAWVTLVGSLPGIFLLASAGDAAGTVESPGELLSPFTAALLTILGVLPVIVRMSIGVPRRRLIISGCIFATVVLGAIVARVVIRYRAADSMTIAVQELTNADYPEDPSSRSIHHGKYQGRALTLVKRDDTHFDFAFEPRHSHIARIVFKNVDCSLLTPNLPEWVKGKSALERIALASRQFARQQVRFGGSTSPYLEVTGGDGFEKQLLYSAELVKNSLHAGLWEVMLYTHERGEKTLYYQGWFSFPLGHYKRLFEHNTGLSYWKHFYYLEHQSVADGQQVKLEDLRTVSREAESRCVHDSNELVFAAGEQARRRRLTMGENVRFWKDYTESTDVRFAAFVAPGRYRADRLQGHQLNRIEKFEKALTRQIVSCADREPRSEIELVFANSRNGKKCRLIVSGFQWDLLPAAPIEEYPRGRYMPMGLAVPPIFQDYPELARSAPNRSPYFAMFVDEEGRFLDPHSMGIEGPIVHRDVKYPNWVHLYLMSYERHALVGHWIIERT
ncbi:SNARE associated Golgi protein [Caulifigura coniformis]|uniref:SNARE associated Golgi protein n=2 Tax=Caulifigura coniformis TaxID=2527983 RepID=A0A517SBN9_9PLAN|nr:SNARE associated Golgi protein [Caulifigura coniformis]